jgi:hypothetical protein
LTAELSFRPYLSRNPSHLGGKRTELINHRVDGVFQFEKFAFDIDGNFLRQIAVSDGAGDASNVTNLTGQVAGHQVYVIGEILPGTRQTSYGGLTAQIALRAHLPGDPGNLRSKRTQLIDHRVYRAGGAEELAFEGTTFHFDRHHLGKISLGYSADNSGHFARWPNQISNQVID